MTFLDYLLIESNFSNEEIENEVQTFMFAVSTKHIYRCDYASKSHGDEILKRLNFFFKGHDTTTAAISFCLYELSNNPNVQVRYHLVNFKVFSLQ